MDRILVFPLPNNFTYNFCLFRKYELNITLFRVILRKVQNWCGSTTKSPYCSIQMDLNIDSIFNKDVASFYNYIFHLILHLSFWFRHSKSKDYVNTLHWMPIIRDLFWFLLQFYKISSFQRLYEKRILVWCSSGNR